MHDRGRFSKWEEMMMNDPEANEREGKKNRRTQIIVAIIGGIFALAAAVIGTVAIKEIPEPIRDVSVSQNGSVDAETQTDASQATTVSQPTTTTQQQKIFLGEHIVAYKKQEAKEYNPQTGNHFTMGGMLCYRGLTMATNGDAYAFYNLDGIGLSKISGLLGCTDDMDGNSQATISFYGDDKLLQQIKLGPDKLPSSFEITITGVNQLRIHCTKTSGGLSARVGLADVIFE